MESIYLIQEENIMATLLGVIDIEKFTTLI